MVSTIEQALESKNPVAKASYQQNASDYRDRLTALDASYRTTLATAKIKEIVYAGHYAFGYLARRYGLGYLAAQGVSPDSEPTANDLARLVEQVRNDQIHYIFYEELTSPKIAETLARETDAKLLLLKCRAQPDQAAIRARGYLLRHPPQQSWRTCGSDWSANRHE